MNAADSSRTGLAAARARSDAPAGAEGDLPPDLGILFVHGIGHQRPGQTLVEFGDPLIAWIDEWFARVPAPGPAARAAALQAAQAAQAAADPADPAAAAPAAPDGGRIDVVRSRVVGDSATPAHASVVIQVHRQGEDQTRRWLLAESCWAKAFLPPSFADLAYWGFAVYPWTSGSHFGAQLRRLWQRAAKTRNPWLVAAVTFLTPVYVVGAVVASVLVIVALLLLLALAIPPIPSLRAALLRAQQALAETVGDSFILVASPIQRAAILSHVSRDIEWLIARGCRRIAIVAHSQGAAVAFEAMAAGVVRGRRPGETLLITFGSGLGKLHEIEAGRRSDKAQRGWMAIGGLALLVLSLQLAGIINPAPWIGTWDDGAMLVGFFGVLLWGSGTFFEDKLELARFDPVAKFGADVRWRDFYASEDPVANGPLFDRDPAFLRSREVHNRAAPWSDHTTYWRNRDEFIPCVVRELGRFSSVDILHACPGDTARLSTAVRRRKWRVRWLAAARLVAAALTTLLVYMRWESLPAWGATALERLPAVNKILGWIGGNLFGGAVMPADPLAQRLAGIAFVATLVGAGYHLLYLAWRIWSRTEQEKLFDREAHVADEGYWMFVLLFLLLVDLGLLVGLGWLLGGGTPRGLVENMRWAAYLLAPGVLAGAVVFFGRVIRFWWMGPSGRSTFRAAAAVTLVVAPVTAAVLSAHLEKWWMWLALLGTFVLAYVLIVFSGNLILPETQLAPAARPLRRPRTL